MPHARELIRDAVVTACTGLATTGARVYRSRVYPLSQALLPALLVFVTSEEAEPETMGLPQQIIRMARVVVEGYARASADYDETLDDIAAEVETAIGADPTLGGRARLAQIESTEIEFAGDGDQPVGVIRMTFRVEYRTAESNPTALA
jgi:hypothetical protein